LSAGNVDSPLPATLRAGRRCACGRWAGVPIAGATGATRVEAPGPPWTRLNAARPRARGASRSYGTRWIRPFQAGSRRTASRRAEPLPTLSHAQQRPARSDNNDNSDNGDNGDNSKQHPPEFRSVQQAAGRGGYGCFV